MSQSLDFVDFIDIWTQMIWYLSYPGVNIFHYIELDLWLLGGNIALSHEVYPESEDLPAGPQPPLNLLWGFSTASKPARDPHTFEDNESIHCFLDMYLTSVIYLYTLIDYLIN